MDHLPQPENADLLMIEVPFLCTIAPSTVKEFRRYPANYGLSVDEDGIIDVAALFDLSYDEQLSFIQASLYFAPLQLVCKSATFNISDFRRIDANSRALPETKKLPHYCNKVHQWLLGSNRDEAVLDCLIIAQRNFAIINQDNEFTRKSHFSAILLSIRILYDYIWNSDTSFTDIQTRQNCYESHDDSKHSIPSTILLRKHMKDRGWCPHEINKLLSYVPADTLHFLASIPRSRNRMEGHDACSSIECVVYNNSELSDGGHLTDSCACSNVKPSSPEELHSIIARGRIPLMSFSQSPDGEIHLSYIEAQPSTSYIAISYLWADGLGKTNIRTVCRYVDFGS
jgi:hypothetical protein